MSEPTTEVQASGVAPQRGLHGGRFDFDDGGTYCGGWDDGKAHGHGVCTGPKGQGAYAGSWNYGFEVSGVYTWPSGSTFEGQWQNGKRHGLGVESRGRWLYRGEWTQGFKGRYGVRQSTTSSAKYEGTWAYGLQDGYGSESYADGGTYQGQWLRGMRHGYGVRASAPFGLASHYRGNKVNDAEETNASNGSLSDIGPDSNDKRTSRLEDARGGFVLKAKSDEPPARRNSLVEKTKKNLFSGLKLRKQKSTGELERQGGGSGSIRSNESWYSSVDSTHSGLTSVSLSPTDDASFIIEEHLDANITETYMGEWKNDKRTGFGVSERSDGLKYEGEWFNNRKYGYGVTTFRDGSREEGKYKNNVLITSNKRKHVFLMRSAKFRERIDGAINAAQRASKIAMQKADIAISRATTARTKAEQADSCADQAKEDCELAQTTARQFAPDFKIPSMDRVRFRERYRMHGDDMQPTKSILHQNIEKQTEPSSTGHLLQSQQIMSQTSFPGRRPSAAYPKTVPIDLKSNPSMQNFNTNEKPSLSSSIPGNTGLATDLNNINRRFSRDQQLSSDQTTNPLYSNINRTEMTQNLLPNGPTYNDTNQQNYRTTQTDEQFDQRLHDNILQPNLYGQTRNEEQMMPDYNRNQSDGTDRLNGSVVMQEQNVFTRRNSRQTTSHRPSIDYFDHYQRPPSRDSSVDRYGRKSQQRSTEGTSRAPSQVRSPTPLSNGQVGPPKGTTPTLSRANSREPPFEESIMRQRTLGQEVSPSPYQPKRTESLFVPPKQTVAPISPGGPGKRVDDEEEEELLCSPAILARRASESWINVPPAEAINTAQTLQRKKSLPEVANAVPVAPSMSREEVSALGSARREQVRRMAEESERLRANPLLYLVSPQVKNWFSRQQLVLVVLFINISLGIMFFKLLT